MYACNILQKNAGEKASHIVLDPSQSSIWDNVGLYNLEKAGFDFVRHVAKGSEIALPELFSQGVRVDAAIVDGWHTFDHALVDCFYVNKMLKVGGVMILDDTEWPSINKLIRYLASYPCYEVFGVANMKESARVDFENAKNGSVSWGEADPGVFGTAVALKKVSEDKRSWDWWAEF